MGNGASSASKRLVPASDQSKAAAPSKQRPESSASKMAPAPGSAPPPGAAMRAPWGSCVLGLHVAQLFSKLDFDVSRNPQLGCLHSVAIRCATEGDSDQPSAPAQSPFAAARRELGELPGDELKEQEKMFKDAAEKLEDFHEFAQTYARIFCNDHIRSSFQRKKSNFLSAGAIVSTLPWLHSMVHAGVLFMMVDCTLLQVANAFPHPPLAIASVTRLQFDVNSSMAETAFHVSAPGEKPQGQPDDRHDVQWEEDATVPSKKWGAKPKAAGAGRDAAALLMRTAAPDFEWPQPWEQVWSNQSLPSASSAHYLIERTNKLWQSELASLRPLWLGANTGICPALSCVIEVHGFFIKVIALCPTSTSGPTDIFAQINFQLSQVQAVCNQLPLLKQYGHFLQGRQYYLMTPLFMTPMISTPAVASFICSKHGAQYVVGKSKRNFTVTQDSVVLSHFSPGDVVEFHLLRRALVHRLKPLLLAAAGQRFSVTEGEKHRKMPQNQDPDALGIASDQSLPFLPVTQRLIVLQVAMFDQLPELIELLDQSFPAPASESAPTRHHSLIIEEHLGLMRRQFKAKGLGLVWLGVVRANCSAAAARAVALNEMVARVVKLSVRRRLRSAKVEHHKASDGTDVAQTPKEDCVLMHGTISAILQDWRSFCRSSLVLLMAAKFPGCLHDHELHDPDALFACISPMLCVQRAARLLHITLDHAAFRDASRDCPTGEALFGTAAHPETSLEQYVIGTMKAVAAPLSHSAPHAGASISPLTDDVVVSSPVVLKSHCPVSICQAAGLLLETRALMLTSAGLMPPPPPDSSHLSAKSLRGQAQRERSVCDDAFLDAFELELLTAGISRQIIKLAPVMQVVSFMDANARKHVLVQFKKMSAALSGVDLELLSHNSTCVFVVIEGLLALSDVATGASKCFFLRSALEWMDSLWKAQEIASIRAIRALQSRKTAAPQSSLLKKLKSLTAQSLKAQEASAAGAGAEQSGEAAGSTHAQEEKASDPPPALKKRVSNAKAAAAEMARVKQDAEQSMKENKSIHNRIHSKLYHASVFVAFMCSCCPSAIKSKLKGQWCDLKAGFEVAYRKFIACVEQGAFSAQEVKRVLWHSMMLLKPLAHEYRVLQSSRNPSARYLLDAFDAFARFTASLDNTARSFFEQEFASSYEPLFPPQACHMIFILSLNAAVLRRVFPNCPHVSEAVHLLAEGSFYQLLHGEVKALAQEMQDVDVKQTTSIAEVLSRFTKRKTASDPLQRRNDEAMKVVLARLTQHSVSDDFLSVDTSDLDELNAGSVAMLIVGLMVQCNMHLRDIVMTDSRASQTSQDFLGSSRMNLQHALIAGDTLDCLCTLLQSNSITSISCRSATICGSVPPSFAAMLKHVALLDLQAVQFRGFEDDFILRKILSIAESATHVNVAYTQGLGDEELFALANASGDHLISLNICQSSDVTDVGLCYLASRCSSLQRLHVLGCENVCGRFVAFVAAYCPALACFDVNFSDLKMKYASLLPQLTENHDLRMKMHDVDLLVKLGALPSLESIENYLKNHQTAGTPKASSATEDNSSKIGKSSSVLKQTSGITPAKRASLAPTAARDGADAGDASNKVIESFNADAVVKVSVAEANRVFGGLERVDPKALVCIEQWISLLYGPSESNRAWLGRAEFAPSMMSKYDAATDDYLVINEDDPEIELQFNEMLDDFTRRGLDSDQCFQEVKAVLLKKRIEQKENVMAERRVVAEMERDRRTLTTKSEYEEMYQMSGRAAQDADAVRRMRLDIAIAARRQTHLDRIHANKGPGNIAFAPQTIMRMEALFKNPGDRVAVHPVLHVYVHCILYENENPDASSKISSYVSVSYDREFRQTPALERSNFVDVMEGFTFDLRFGLSDMVVIEMREASANSFESSSQENRMIGIVFAPLPESVNHSPQKLWYKFKGVPPKVREANGKVVPTLGGQVLVTTMITTSEVGKRLEHALDSVNDIEKADAARDRIESIRYSVTSKLRSLLSRAPPKQRLLEEQEEKKLRDAQLRASFLAKNVKKMQILQSIIAKNKKAAIPQPLVHLDLSASGVRDNNLAPLLLQATNLTVLRLSHCQNLTPALFDEILGGNVAPRAAGGSPLCKLNVLSLRNTPACDDSAIIRICASSSSLHSLDIGQNQRRITNASVSVMAEQLGGSLRRLMMDSCPAVTEEFHNMIIAAIGAACTVLNLAFQSLSPFALAYIVSQGLQELTLNGIACVLSADVRRVCSSCPMLQHCPDVGDDAFACDRPVQLQDVNLSHCSALTDVGLLRLASCSPRLQVLNIASLPRISNAGVLCLPARCPCLTFLNVAFCPNVFAIAFQALPVLLPNAKIVGIESLSFGNSDRDLSHLQNKQRPPHATPRDDAADREWQADAVVKGAESAASQPKANRLPFAARRALNLVRMGSRADR